MSYGVSNLYGQPSLLMQEVGENQGPSLNQIREKIIRQGILTLNEPELQVLEKKTKSEALPLEKVKSYEQLHKKNIAKKAKIKKIIKIVAAVVVIGAAIFALAYFAAPAIALATTIHIASGTAGALPHVVAAAKAALAAGTFIKLGFAHGILSAAYLGLPMIGIVSFLRQNVKEQQKEQDYNQKVEEAWKKLQA